jgi:hypothetical protein
MADALFPSNVTDEEIAEQFEGTDFGTREYRKLLEQGVLKTWCGYHCGHTLTTIMQRLGLITDKRNVTTKGRKFAFAAFYNNGHSA